MAEGETVTLATTTPTPPAEAKVPAGPSVEELQASISSLEAKYGKEIGDRDRGMARQASELEALRERLAISEKSADALARRTFGEEGEPEKTEYQRWKEEHVPPTTQSLQPTPAQALATGRMIQTAKHYGVDYQNPPPELAGLVSEIASLYYSDNPLSAADKWEEELKKRANEEKSRAEAETKAEEKRKREEAEKRVKLGQSDKSTSTGGGQSSYEAIRDAYIKNPNDPGTRNAYLEARRARGI